ncbi:MAG: hydratase, partial [Clostridia bacterium]|nr:hydratase [Clostridia bacterium]
LHGRPEAYMKLEPGAIAYYDGLIKVDLTSLIPMIALPFHPSHVYTIKELNHNLINILRSAEEDCRKAINNPAVDFSLTDKIVGGRLKVDQGVVAGCAGGSFENITRISRLFENHSTGNDPFSLNIYPASQPINLALVRNGSTERLMQAGAIVKSAFCGPCFGAGDTPANHGLSIRHTTRNFPFREGSKPGSGQIAAVALMDALSIAATAVHGGFLTPATEMDIPSESMLDYTFDDTVYRNRVYYGYHKPKTEEPLQYGPNIADWPQIPSLSDHILLEVVSVIEDPVTTTDELIPSGETSSYRSNPLKLAEFTLSRRDPYYVERAKKVQKEASEWLKDRGGQLEAKLKEILSHALKLSESEDRLEQVMAKMQLNSAIFATKPGDGSAREQAASCQRVLGGLANIAKEYATKRYRSNLINWGMLPFTLKTGMDKGFEVGDHLFVENIKEKVMKGQETIEAVAVRSDKAWTVTLELKNLSDEERKIILAGCLINYYAGRSKDKVY